MNTKTEHPLRGKPRTIVRHDKKGVPTFYVNPNELTPFRAIVADRIDTAKGWGLAALSVVFVSDHPEFDLLHIALVAAMAYAMHKATKWVITELARRQTSIAMSTDAISVRTLFGWRRYDRNLEHAFGLIRHDGAKAEYERHDMEIREAASKGKLLQKKAYYGESFHVALSYAGHRVDLLTVFGQKEATAIAARLQYCDRCLNEAVHMGGGINQHAEDDWNDVPGGLRDA